MGVTGKSRARLRNRATRAITSRLAGKIDDHIDYLMVRIDPEMVTPLRAEPRFQQSLNVHSLTPSV
jgi:hypothetical protein